MEDFVTLGTWCRTIRNRIGMYDADRRLRGVLGLAPGRNSLGAGDVVQLRARTEGPEQAARISQIRWGAVGFG